MNRALSSVSFAALTAFVVGVPALAGVTACNEPAQQQPPPQTAQQYPQQYPQPYPQQYPQSQPGQYPQQQPYPTQQPYPQQPPQPQPTYTAPAPQPTYTTPPAPTPAPTTPPAPAPTTTQTSPFPFPLPPSPSPSPSTPSQSGGGSTATPIDPTFAQVATAPLFVFQATEAPGMSREGNIVAAQFQEGQTMETPVTLQPNKCYTVLAVGVGLLSEVDINLVLTTPVPGLNQLLARDSGAGTHASLGGKGNCYPWKLPFSAQAKWVIIATKGTGLAAGAVYSK